MIKQIDLKGSPDYVAMMAAHLSSLICLLCILILGGVSIEASLNEIPLERATFKNYPAKSRIDDLFTRFRRAAGPEVKSREDEIREEYERRLFESLNSIGSIQPTRLYVPEYIYPSRKAFNIEVGTVVGKVRKIFPYGKQLMVWPYLGYRNFTVDSNTGVVRTTAKMDFELIRSYNMTIRDFRHDYSDLDPLRIPPMPYPRSTNPTQDYVDHYLFVEVIDRNDKEPKFNRNVTPSALLSGTVNSNATAGTPVLYINPEDEDTGLRGKIRFNIRTENNNQSGFTIDPKTHYLKRTGTELASGLHMVHIEALDYGTPPKSSGFQEFSVRVGRISPEFAGTPYDHNFSEANVRGSVVAKVQAISRSGAPVKYEILTDGVKNTFAINQLGELTLLRELDYDTAKDSDRQFSFVVRATEQIYGGLTRDVDVNLKLLNVDDHLGMFKTPAKRLILQEHRSPFDLIYKIEDFEDCDCATNCSYCQAGEMIYSIEDTSGFFGVTKDGRIMNLKDLDAEHTNYFQFPIYVTDSAINGRKITSYLEVTVVDVDDSAPMFPQTTYEFSIFEDVPKDQIVGVVQAFDLDLTTEPDNIIYTIIRANPFVAREYFTVEKHGVIKVFKNDNQLRGSDIYELTIIATDESNHQSYNPAIVTIHALDVNNHIPVFRDCKERSINENEPVGTLLTTLIATDEDRGVNKLIEYSLLPFQGHNFFKIDNETGEVRTTHVLDREQYEEIFVVAKATDSPGKISPLRQSGYCQFVVKIGDVNDHQPKFPVESFDVRVLRTLPKGANILRVEAEDPDLGVNGEIEYRILTQKIGQRPVNYIEVVEETGEVRVKNSMLSLDLIEEITVVIKATNKKKVIGSVGDSLTETTVNIKFSTEAPPKFNQSKYIVDVPENSTAGSTVFTLRSIDNNVVYSLQLIRDRDNLPFYVGSATGTIKTIMPLNFEQKKSYVFAVAAQKQGDHAITSILLQVNVVKVINAAPTFGRDRYEASVSEAAGPGVDVFRVRAFDPDSTICSMFYEIEKQYDWTTFLLTNMTTFAEIKTTPNITTGFFDREKKSNYTIVITAYKQCFPGLKASVVLFVNVVDENDSPPVFTANSYEVGPILETVPVPYTVPDLVLKATDEDIRSDVRYYITSGNDGRFSMETVVRQSQENTGRLIVSHPLKVKKSPEFERNPVYTLTITATDGRHTTNTTVIVRVS